MKRRGFVGLAVAVVAIVVGAVVILTRRDTTTPIGADDARAAATSTEASPSVTTTTAGADDAVVYVYTTTGFEEIDALAGASHEYPPETFLTVRQAGCGEVFRWQAIEERWISWDLCDRERLAVAGVDSFHRWFGVDDAQSYRCIEPAQLLPPTPDVDTWTFTCVAAERTEETTATVVGEESLVIDGRDVDALHVRYISTLTGESTGGSVIDRWFNDEGLLLREVSSTASASSSGIGTVNYTEEYEITLRSLQPLP